MAIIDIKSEVNGAVWKLLVAQGDTVEEDQEIAILESMKMEIPVLALCDGIVTELLVQEGDVVSDGQVLAKIEE